MVLYIASTCLRVQSVADQTPHKAGTLASYKTAKMKLFHFSLERLFMTSVHYFPRYSQLENFVTNNCLLLLSRLYDFNRFKFEKLISMRCSDNDASPPDIRMQFRQQIGTSASVVDGYISQRSLYLAVETKLGDTFDLNQLKRHLNIFKDGRDQQFLLLLSKSENPLSSDQRESLNKVLPKDVEILQASFETLIRYSKNCLSEYDEEMIALVADFEAFYSSSKLLSTDRYTMFVPPCGRSYKENIEYKLYYCPASWNRRKAKYLGIYTNREVRAIGEIKKIVACNIKLDTLEVQTLEIEGDPLTSDECARILGAAKSALARNGLDLSNDNKFFLCEKMEATRFRKQTSGGIMGHHYLNLKAELQEPLPENLSELARLLSVKSWE